MKRHAYDVAPGRSSAASELDAAVPGKRCLAEPHWVAVVTALGVDRPRAFGTWEVIQRQESEDTGQLHAELQRIAAGARDAETETLRALAAEAEALRPAIEASEDASLQAALVETQDAIVRAFQHLAVTHADATLQAWSSASAGDRTKQRAAYLRGSGYPGATDAVDDWCGMFANTQLRAAGFAPEFNLAFNHSDNVPQFFTYDATTRSPGTIQPRGVGDVQDLRTYHAARGSERSWIAGDAIGNDLRAGDVITVDWDGGDGQADHICIVASFTPAGHGQPARVVTIDGNTFGVSKGPDDAAAFDGSDEMTEYGDMKTNDVSTSRYERRVDGVYDRSAMLPDGRGHQTMRIVGRGRPSCVDFEAGHVYPEFTDGVARDQDGPMNGPIQRAGGGAVATADPGAAFDAAASGAPGELPFRGELQSRFGADFSSVQVYTGRDLSALGARAATRGEQVAFAAATPDKQTVAHELAHVLQSRQGRTGDAAVSDPGDASEQEARAVESAVDGEGPIGIGSAPSAAIHRDEDPTIVPSAVVPASKDNHPGAPIDWSRTTNFISKTYRLPVSNSQPASIREVYEFFLLRYFARELPESVAAFGALPAEELPSYPDGRHVRHAAADGVTAATQARITELLAAGDRTGADAVRVKLFACNEHALADALLIPGSSRHAQERDATGKITDTFCNVFAFDVVTAMGGYLPRQWWTPDAEALILERKRPSADQVVQLRANGLYDWMRRWGDPHFGWHAVATAADAQAAAAQGKLVVILASTGSEEPGHISVVMAPTSDRRPPTDAETTGDDFVPLQAQAGGENFATNAAGVAPAEVGETGRRDWWNDGQYHGGAGFFAYEPNTETPGYDTLTVQASAEAMGTTLPK
jgi:hypothetical protein